MYSILILLLLLAISLPILIFRRKLFNNYKSNGIKWEWELGSLERPLKYLYLIISIILLVITTYFLYDYRGIIINPVSIKGNITRIHCVDKDKACNPLGLIYVVKYKINDEQYTINSSSSGIRTQFPSTLYKKGANVGDFVEILASNDNNSKAILKDDRSYFVFSSVSIWVLAFFLFINSFYLIKKRGQN